MEAIKDIGLSKQIKNIILTIVGTLILTLSAKIQTPLAPVPVTMQTFAVLFLGMAFGYKIATASVILYLVQGAIGIPVFAKGGGLIYFQGPTSGYLFGFIIGAFVSGYVKINSGTLLTFTKLVFSVSFIYLFGLIWLYTFMGFEKSFFEIFKIGAQPFLLAELLKILILAILVKTKKII